MSVVTPIDQLKLNIIREIYDSASYNPILRSANLQFPPTLVDELIFQQQVGKFCMTYN